MIDNKNPFTVHVDGNLVVVTRFGAQSAESVIAIRKEVIQLMEADKTLRNLLVVVKATSIPDGPSVQASIQSLREIPYDRTAIVSSVPQRLAVAKGISNASEAGERVKLFRSEEDARAWLAEK